MKTVKRSMAIICALIILVSSFAVIAQNASAETGQKSYEQYRADWYKDSTTLELYLNDFEAPYQTYVDNAPADFDAALMTWKVGSLGFEAGATYTTEQVDFYQLLLFDVLWQEYSNPTYASEIEKNLKMLDLSVIKELNKKDEDLALSTPITSENAGQILEQMKNIDAISDAIEFKDTLQKYIGYVTDVEDLVERLCKVQMLLSLPNETSKILADMGVSTDDMGMFYALNEFEQICSGEMGEAEIVALFTSEKAESIAFKESLSELWSETLKASPLAPIYVGQQVGKFVSNTFLGTDKIADSYYSMEMLCDFQKILKEQVLRYRTNYEASPTESNARILNQAISMYLKTMNTGMDYSIRYVEAVKSGGLVNYLYSTFSEKNYDKVLSQLKSIQSNIAAEIKFFNTEIRNWYDDEYGIPSYPIEKEPQNMTKTEFDASVLQMTKDVFAVTNRTFTEDYTLTSDLETYGDVVLESGTLDLNGHKLIIRGSLTQSGGTLNVNGGTLEVGGDYRIQTFNPVDGSYGESNGVLQMTNSRDHVLVQGDFVTQSTRGHNGGDLTNGTLELKGNFSQLNGYTGNFYTSQNHKMIFSGAGKQKIYFESDGQYAYDSQFVNVDFKCGSIYLETPVYLGKEHKMNSDLEVYPEKGVSLSNNAWNLNGHTLTIHGKDGIYENNEGNINSASGKLVIDKDLVLKSGSITGGNTEVKGNTRLQGANVSLDLEENKMNIADSLIQENGSVNVNGGTLEIGGDYRIQTFNPVDGSYGESNGVLQMTNSRDHVLVQGDFVTQSTRGHNGGDLTNGTLELKGNFSQLNGYTGNFYTSQNHKMIFSGAGKQKIYFESDGQYAYDSQFVNVDFKCGSIYLETPVYLGKEHKMNSDLEVYPEKGVSLSNNAWNLNGHTLTIHGKDGIYENNEGNINSASGKLVIDKDLVLKSGSITGGNTEVKGNTRLQGANVSLDLEENKMNIADSLIQENGSVNVNGGTLEIGGDYRIQTFNPVDGSYGESNGVLQMTNSKDYVLVQGDFVTQSTNAHYQKLTNGTLELKGNFTQLNGSENNFDASQNHKVILSGNEGQTAIFESLYSQFNILEIANLRSTYSFMPDPCWNKLIERVKKGDLNGNGVIDVMDARKVKQVAMKEITLTPEEMKLVDLNGDGKIDIMEARRIKRAAMKEITLN